MANVQMKFLLLCTCILVLQTTKGVSGQCATNLTNQAVYEGAVDTLMICNSGLKKMSYAIKPASDPLTTSRITNYDDVVAPGYTDLYGVNTTGLIIKTAQGTATIPPISTAGLYVVRLNGTASPTTGVKLIVVRQPPSCGCTANSTNQYMTCSLDYADVTYEPINAKMTWTADGMFYKNDTPVRILEKPYYVSASSIAVDVNDPATYQCTVTFAKPMNLQFPYTDKSAPTFSASCSPAPCVVPSTPLPTSTASTSATACNCEQTTSCPTPNASCTEASECQSDGTNMTAILDECVVKTELYARCDKCCAEDFVCGVVVTLRNDSRWLIHDSTCGDNSCQMVAVDASCMSSDWKLLTERKVITAGVRDFIEAGNKVQNEPGLNDCSDSCKRMMNLL